MSNPDKPTQMQIAMEYLAAFCTAAVVAGFAGLVVATRQYPDDQSAISGITLAAGFLAGATACLIPPVRRFLGWIGKYLSGF